LLILDEATSALDFESEERIHEAIDELHGRATILLITHRLSTLRRTDRIYVMEHGRLTESGTWDALLQKRNGRFRDLCLAQGIVAAGPSRVPAQPGYAPALVQSA
jgi:ABC-type multidrug transport system fused ATPase/permease subunit